MMGKYNQETQKSFNQIESALEGKTNDDLCYLMEELNRLYLKAQDIYNIRSSFIDGSDYQIPERY